MLKKYQTIFGLLDRYCFKCGKHEISRTGDSATSTVAGVVLGLALAYGLTRLLASLLFGVKASDPATFGLVAGVLALVALTAAYIPARRAYRYRPSDRTAL